MINISSALDLLKNYSSQLKFESETNLPFTTERVLSILKANDEDVQESNLFEKIKISGLERLIPKDRIIVTKCKQENYLLPLVKPGTIFKVKDSCLIFDDLYKNNKLDVYMDNNTKNNDRLLILDVHQGIEKKLTFMKLYENELKNYKKINLTSIQDIENKIINYNSIIEESVHILKNDYKNTFLNIFKQYLKSIKTSDLMKFEKAAKEMGRTGKKEIKDLRFLVLSGNALKTSYATDIFPTLNIQCLQLFIQRINMIEGIVLVDPFFINFLINKNDDNFLPVNNDNENQRDLLSQIVNLLGCYKTISFNELNILKEVLNYNLPLYEGNWIFICPENIEKFLILLSNKKELFELQEPFNLLSLHIFNEVEKEINIQRNILYKFVLNHEIGHAIYKDDYNYEINQFKITFNNVNIDKETSADLFSCYFLQPEEIFFIDLIKEYIVEKIDVRLLANEVVKNVHQILNQFSTQELERRK